MKACRFSILFILSILGVLVTSAVSASPLELSDYDGRWLLIVFTDDGDDIRPFDLNLALSVEWDQLESRDVTVLDVAPGRWDIVGIAAQFDLGTPGFAVILVDPRSRTRFITRSIPTVSEITEQIDRWSPPS